MCADCLDRPCPLFPVPELVPRLFKHYCTSTSTVTQHIQGEHDCECPFARPVTCPTLANQSENQTETNPRSVRGLTHTIQASLCRYPYFINQHTLSCSSQPAPNKPGLNRYHRFAIIQGNYRIMKDQHSPPSFPSKHYVAPSSPLVY